MAKGAAELLSEHIDPSDTRIQKLPDFILVFGGPLGNPRDSARQLFLNWIDIHRADLSEWVIKPEDYQDWNNLDGYQNLIDFERDAICLTRAVVLFSESPGSHAELGAFCMDPMLSERLLVVISEQHYNAGSFIAKGPIKKIESLNDDSVCAVTDIKYPGIDNEMPGIIDSLDNKIKSLPRTMQLDLERTRDQFLLIADLIELFGSLTITEVHELCRVAGFNTTIPHIKSMYGQLERFGIVASVKKYTQRYYIPTARRFSFLNYKGKTANGKFDRLRFKTTVTFPWLSADKKRFEAYCNIHGEAA